MSRRDHFDDGHKNPTYRREPEYADEFEDYAVRSAGVTPNSPTWDIEDAANDFVYNHDQLRHHDDDRLGRHISRLTEWFSSQRDEDDE